MEFFLVRIQENTDQKKLHIRTLFMQWMTLQKKSGITLFRRGWVKVFCKKGVKNFAKLTG